MEFIIVEISEIPVKLKFAFFRASLMSQSRLQDDLSTMAKKYSLNNMHVIAYTCMAKHVANKVCLKKQLTAKT